MGAHQRRVTAIRRHVDLLLFDVLGGQRQGGVVGGDRHAQHVLDAPQTEGFDGCGVFVFEFDDHTQLNRRVGIITLGNRLTDILIIGGCGCRDAQGRQPQQSDRRRQRYYLF